jgi:hypothetical protein
MKHIVDKAYRDIILYRGLVAGCCECGLLKKDSVSWRYFIGFIFCFISLIFYARHKIFHLEAVSVHV